MLHSSGINYMWTVSMELELTIGTTCNSLCEVRRWVIYFFNGPSKINILLRNSTDQPSLLALGNGGPMEACCL